MTTKVLSQQAGWVVSRTRYTVTLYRDKYVHIESIVVENGFFPSVRKGSHTSIFVIPNFEVISHN